MAATWAALQVAGDDQFRWLQGWEPGAACSHGACVPAPTTYMSPFAIPIKARASSPRSRRSASSCASPLGDTQPSHDSTAGGSPPRTTNHTRSPCRIASLTPLSSGPKARLHRRSPLALTRAATVRAATPTVMASSLPNTSASPPSSETTRCQLPCSGPTRCAVVAPPSSSHSRRGSCARSKHRRQLSHRSGKAPRGAVGSLHGRHARRG